MHRGLKLLLSSLSSVMFIGSVVGATEDQQETLYFGALYFMGPQAPRPHVSEGIALKDFGSAVRALGIIEDRDVNGLFVNRAVYESAKDRNADTEVYKRYVKANPQVIKETDADGLNLFGHALLRHSADCHDLARFLLAEGSAPHVVTRSGDNLLHLAAHRGISEDMVGLLLEQGVNVTGVNGEGNTPIHVACRNDNDKALKLMLRDGRAAAILNLPNKRGYTPLHLAVYNPFVEDNMITANLRARHEMAWALINAGADQEIPQPPGKKPLREVFRQLQSNMSLTRGSMGNCLFGSACPDKTTTCDCLHPGDVPSSFVSSASASVSSSMSSSSSTSTSKLKPCRHGDGCGLAVARCP